MPVSLLPPRPIDTSWMERCNRPEPPKQSSGTSQPSQPPKLCARCGAILAGTTWRRYCPTCAPIVAEEKQDARIKRRKQYKPKPCKECGGEKLRKGGVKYCPTCKPIAKARNRKPVRGEYWREKYWTRRGLPVPPPRGYARKLPPLPSVVPMKRTGSLVSRMIPEPIRYSML